jgi:unconventional prefoldin RPB5 interactor 1
MASGSLHRASEDVRLDHLKEQHELMLNDARERGKKWSGHRDEYAKLKERLKGLPDRATVEAMVPLGKKAFMAGHLVHTNEIMVLLGDNW